MPGINCLVLQPCRGDKNPLAHFETRVDVYTKSSTGLLPHIRIQASKPAENLLLVEVAENLNHTIRDGWILYFEGKIDNVGMDRLFLLLEEAASKGLGKADLQDCWNKNFQALTGSFFCLAIHTEKQLLLFANDALSRLPVYIFQREDVFFVGRDIGLARGLCPSPSLNLLYLALFQIFCYVPGRGTCYEEIDTLPGATIGVYNWQTNEYLAQSNPDLRLVEPLLGGSKKKRLRDLIDSFGEVVSEYQSYDDILLALSGGFDSRAVGAALSRKSICYKSLTYIDEDKTASDDSYVAKLLATALGCSHELISLHPETEEQYRQLFTLKEGLNYLGMSFFLEFLDKLRCAYPHNSIMITGDGGDKVLPNLVPDGIIRDKGAWLDLLYQKNAFFDPSSVAKVFGLNPRTIDEYLLNLIESYPGKDLRLKYKYFLISERSGRWLFEGEDRNRYYIKSETPFLDYRFFKVAMQIPDEWKASNAYFSMFIQALYPPANQIRLANSRVVPKHLSNPAYQMLLHSIRWLRSLKPGQSSPQPRAAGFHMQSWIIDTLVNGFAQSKFLSGGLEQGCFGNREQLSKLNRAQLNIILTISSIINREL